MAPRTRTLVMPRTGATVRTARSTRYVLVAQWEGCKAHVVQGSKSYDTLRTALDRRLRKPYTYTMTHARPDYAIFDLADTDRDGLALIVAQSKGDGPRPVQPTPQLLAYFGKLTDDALVAYGPAKTAAWEAARQQVMADRGLT